MHFKKMSIVALACFNFSAAAYANNVVLKSNKPVNVSYKLAHVTQDQHVEFGEMQTVDVNGTVTLPVDLKGDERTGVAIISANGRSLPSSVVGFNQPQQCSMTTDKSKTTGTIEFILLDDSITCRTSGGVFG